MKRILICGAGGFIGSHLARRLKADGHYIVGADLKYPSFSETACDEFYIGDLSHFSFTDSLFTENCFDEVYQLAADMGGAGYIFTGAHDADIMHNSAMINLHIAHLAVKYKVGKLFYSSSACIYPAYNQQDPNNPQCSEESAYPAEPDSEYGWEKLFSERLYLSYARNYKLNVRIARFHNIFGPEGTWEGGKEKAPAAICRKVINASTEIEIWGNGTQTRSFLFIDECINAMLRLMTSDFEGPVNIGSNEMISIGELAQMAIDFSGKKIRIKYIPGPTGVKGRNSDNNLIQEKLGWQPSYPLRKGMKETYRWIESQISK